MSKRTWEDIEDILFDGNEEEIKKLRCPDCGGRLQYSFTESVMAGTLSCDKCKTTIRSNGIHYMPNAVKLFGDSFML